MSSATVWRNPFGCCELGELKPWITVKHDDGSLTAIRQCGHMAQLSGPKARYVSDAVSVDQLSSLRAKLGPVPDLWPETGRKIRK